jgi:SpoVK/Ycf46/Vps4 family AAA+-type ATPase
MEVGVGHEFEESDFSAILENGDFVQMGYEEEDTLDTYEVKPGIWKIIKTNQGMRLVKAEFSKEEILTTFVNTKEIENKIDSFFKKIELGVYNKLKVEIPKRAALLWGPPGTGKTASVVQVSEKYTHTYTDTAVIIWNTDAIDPFDVKNFVQSFEYKDVTKLIVIAEDLGGVEVEQVKLKSMASLLSLLDNKEKTFKIPVFIVATTNFPEGFLGNLTNRPQRFDIKIHVGNPSGNQRKELLTFFLRNFAADYKTGDIESALELITKEKYKDFSIAHLQEVITRSQLDDVTLVTSINSVQKDIELFNAEFAKTRGKLGIASVEYDD